MYVFVLQINYADSRPSTVDVCNVHIRTYENICRRGVCPLHTNIGTSTSTHLCMFTYTALMANCLIIKFSEHLAIMRHGDCPPCACVFVRDCWLYVVVSMPLVATLFQVKSNKNEINCAIVIRTRRKTHVSNRLNVFKESEAPLHTHDQLGPSFHRLDNKN